MAFRLALLTLALGLVSVGAGCGARGGLIGVPPDGGATHLEDSGAALDDAGARFDDAGAPFDGGGTPGDAGLAGDGGAPLPPGRAPMFLSGGAAQMQGDGFRLFLTVDGAPSRRMTGSGYQLELGP